MMIKTNSMLLRGLLGAFVLSVSAVFSSFAQAGGDSFPLNALSAQMLASVEINGVSFQELQQSGGDEGAIAALCQCPYSVLKSEDPEIPWVAYTLFEGEYRLSLSFGQLENGSLGITHLDLLGSEAHVTLQGVRLSVGDPVEKLGAVKSHRQYNGGSLDFALFSGISPNTFFHIDFEPESGEIRKIGYIAPF